MTGARHPPPGQALKRGTELVGPAPALGSPAVLEPAGVPDGGVRRVGLGGKPEHLLWVLQGKGPPLGSSNGGDHGRGDLPWGTGSR